MVRSVDLIFENRICWRVLKFFLNNSRGEFYEKEIQRKTAAARASVRKWLRVLEDFRFLSVSMKGRLKLYRLNRENPLVKQLKVLNTINWLLPKLEAFRSQVELYLYGSASRGEDFESSDIDVLVIGKNRAIIGYIRAIDGRIKVSFFTPLEWAKAAREDPAFYERVERDKIRLV